MKTFILIVSKQFPKTHVKSGEPTHFKEKILNGEKIHTIRNNTPYWSKIVKEVNKGNARLSVREWSGKPYRSEQVEIAEYFQLGFQEVLLGRATGIISHHLQDKGVAARIVPINKIAKNDGLKPDDFFNWFPTMFKNPIIGCIIHFTDFRYGWVTDENK